MLTVVNSSWPLLLGVLMLMVGNSLQGTLLGVRGAMEGFEPALLGYVMSAYFGGFLGGSLLTPILLRRVGHVRVFAALGSLISAAFILYGAFVDPIAWAVMRLIVGFCFSGVYVVAESWLNDASTNENRGKALSAYMIVQMLGIILGQALLNVGDPAGFDLFVLISVLVSVSFAPILLSVSPAPVFQTARRMTLGALYRASPLGFVGSFLLGGTFSAMFGMGAVFATARGLSIVETSIFMGVIYVGGLCLQYPVGYVSDRIDRRRLIIGLTGIGATAAAAAVLFGDTRLALFAAAIAIGGTVNPMYSLLIAHTNDFLEHEQMASASGGLVFVGGVGAIGGPVTVGYLIQIVGPDGYFLSIGTLMAAICGYALYRTTQRAGAPAAETMTYAGVSPTASPVAVEIAQDFAAARAGESGENATAAPERAGAA